MLPKFSFSRSRLVINVLLGGLLLGWIVIFSGRPASYANALSPAAPANLPDSTADVILGGFDHPVAIEIAPNGRVFLAIWGNDGNVGPYRQGSVASWPTLAAFQSASAPDIILGQAGATQFGNPEALVVDSQNRLYVADTYNHRVWVFNNVSATGQQPDFVFGANGTSSALVNLFDFTRGMAIDSQNHLFLTDTFNNRVLVYNLPITSNNPTPIAQFTGFNGPRAVAVDPEDNVYIADSENAVVKVFLQPVTNNNYTTPDSIIGELHATDCGASSGASTTDTYLSCPVDLALDPQGDLVVADTPNHRVLGYPAGSSSAVIVYGQGDFTGSQRNQGGVATADTLSEPLGMTFDTQDNFYLADFANNRVLVFNSSQTPTDTPTATNTPPDGSTSTPTATATATATATETPTATATQPPSNTGDVYEADNGCAQAKTIASDGSVQAHTFHAAGDADWVRFDAIKDARYLIEVQVPTGSPADSALEIYPGCDNPLFDDQNYAFAPGVRLELAAPATGALFLKLTDNNPARGGADVRYELSVRQLKATAASGALIVVAGSLRANDPIQPNIYYVTNAVRQLFINQGYTDDRIQYLAPDTNRANVDAAATVANLQSAITTWAASRLGTDGVLTLYLMDHGDKEVIYLNKGQNEVATSTQIDGWLTQLENSLPGVKINIMIEACYSGSFVSLPNSLSKTGRLVMTSTNDSKLAWASTQGAHFSDHLIEALGRKSSLYTSFQRAQVAAQTFHAEQTAWLDGNGNSIPNEADDYAVAAQRGFDVAGTLSDDVWPPFIDVAAGPTTIADGQGLLRAEVSDDKGVKHVWAAIYPPNYTTPSDGDALVRDEDNLAIARIKLERRSDGDYTGLYTGFQQAGAYRIVIYAEDDDGLTAQPVVLEVKSGGQIFLPLVIR